MRTLAAIALLTMSIAATATPVEARPTYFETLKSVYGIGDGENLDACGVCHFLWTGTGARNPYGSAVEQQLYLGKTITQSILDAAPADSDSDGYINGDELSIYDTLPGYSCDNYFDAVGAPQGYDTYITPLVASCLEPLDIRISPSQINFLTEVGESESVDLTIFNNGSTDLITVSSYGFLGGSDPELSVNGPVTPFDIPVGSNVVLQVVFDPPAATIAQGTLQIVSNDPDENPIDVDVGGLGFVRNLAPAGVRAACFAGVTKAMRKYTKTHLREWSRCYLAEVGGTACDSGARDVALLSASDRLHASVGGAKDKSCAGAGLTPSLLGLPDECGGGCGSTEINSLSDYADCLICRQDAATGDYLEAALGTAPPDLPPNQAGGDAALTCQRLLLGATDKAVRSIQKELGECELGNVTAAMPADCAVVEAAAISKARDKVDASPLKCTDTQDLLGCLFEPLPDPACLGLASQVIATDLVNAVFDQED